MPLLFAFVRVLPTTLLVLHLFSFIVSHFLHIFKFSSECVPSHVELVIEIIHGEKTTLSDIFRFNSFYLKYNLNLGTIYSSNKL